MITTEEKFLLDRMNAVAGKVGLGTLLNKCKNIVKVTYDVAVNGGAVGSILLGTKIPSGAIVTRVFYQIKTAFTSTGNNGTLALSLQSAGDVLAAVDADTLSGIGSGIQDDAVANMLALTAERELTAVVATNALLTGKVDIFVEYVV
jgi:hypothetical protein